MSTNSQSQLDVEYLRQQFESMANDPTYKFRRSRRGMYVNPAVSRDWKWFQSGAVQRDLALTRPAMPAFGAPETAPKDGRMLLLLVEFEDNNLEDHPEPQMTIGHNSLDHTGVDEWQFAGWNWTHDCYTHGVGKVLGWLPFHTTTAAPPQPPVEVPDHVSEAQAAVTRNLEVYHRVADRRRAEAVHPDDAAIDCFAGEALKPKMAEGRAKGRSGWETCPPEVLSRMLREHVEKGDPRDVALFCMMLWSMGARIAAAPQPEGQAETIRTDAEIVQQTEDLARALLSWAHNCELPADVQLRNDRNPRAKSCWAMACSIQELLTATDPENSVAELDGAPEAQPTEAAQPPLTDAVIREKARLYVQAGRSWRGCWSQETELFAQVVEMGYIKGMTAAQKGGA